MPKPKTHPAHLQIKNFDYSLPDAKIARFPLKERDASKLLIYKNGVIKEDIYRHLPNFIPADSLLLFNEAKVIHARLYFKKETGGKIEIFCLTPDKRYPDITTAMMETGQVFWKCLIKGAAKWKQNIPVKLLFEYTYKNGEAQQVMVNAFKIARSGNAFIVKFVWDAALSFSEILQYAGKIPIPPYLKRGSEDSDEIRYQTIFAEREGSVAAPTAALHFTEKIMTALEKRSVAMEKLTLHVGAGTFMPVKASEMGGHEMHSEWIEVSLSLVKRLLKQIQEKKPIITVGTTSARTIESLYWIGVRMLRREWPQQPEIAVNQWYPYQQEDEFSVEESLTRLIRFFEKEGKDILTTKTQLIIAPGYKVKILDGLITNFHQPSSTLLLMIAALIGKDWHTVYDYALNHQFRFLSYGDGSLLWCQKANC